METNLSRRNFFNRSIPGIAVLASIPSIVSACIPDGSPAGMPKILSKGDILLFQGDSITDAGRDKEMGFPNNPRSFGAGYAFLAGSVLLNNFPELDLKLYNRGISGNKVYQLSERWNKDCLDLHPNVISILIGVNDYWHKRNGRYDGTVQVYEEDYRELINRTSKQLPEAKFVIGEPFILSNTSAVDETWAEPFNEYQLAAKKIAGEFNAVWVPFQEIFDEAVKYAPETYWTSDGVHPTMAGAQLMAEAWLKSIE